MTPLTLSQIVEYIRSEVGPDAVSEVVLEGHTPWIRIAPEHFRRVMQMLREHPQMSFDYLQLVTGVDWGDRFDVVYHIYSMSLGHKIALKVAIERNSPRIPTVCDLWPAADWHEREQYDLMGIVFEGHPDLRRILCPEDWEGHPLRKDYVQPIEYHGISNVRQIRDEWYPKPDEDAKAIIQKPPSKSTS
ncbi:MAG: NADH-quinone oxidoreductase subunit C [Candidatus Sumerlaeaceae bacterium]|nr:NADH-quinone oxidoreductase subunit C [Candidatus Sumerlaeaceae bacterium]